MSTTLLSRIRAGLGAARRHGTGSDLVIDHPPSFASRWGYSTPPPQRLVELLGSSTDATLHRLDQWIDPAVFRSVPDLEPSTANGPYWQNRWVSALDAATIFAMVGSERPRHVIEVGSGNSTLFLDAARRHFDIDLHLTAIDPWPRTAIGDAADTVHRTPLERVDQSCFAEVAPGDIVYFDGSHRVLTDSDVVVFFTEVVPNLPIGAIVHVHDVFLPYDYPPAWSRRYYSEQYTLAAMLLAAPRRFEVLAANAHLACTAPERLDEWWTANGGPHRPDDVLDSSFWFRIRR